VAAPPTVFAQILRLVPRTEFEKLARGQSLAHILRESVEVSEGVQTTKVAHALGRKLRLRLPLLNAIYSILFEGRSPREALPVFLTGAE